MAGRMSNSGNLWRLLYEQFLLTIEDNGMLSLSKADSKELAQNLADDATSLMFRHGLLSDGDQGKDIGTASS